MNLCKIIKLNCRDLSETSKIFNRNQHCVGVGGVNTKNNQKVHFSAFKLEWETETTN